MTRTEIRCAQALWLILAIMVAVTSAYGGARVIDGDTLRLDGETVRLWGIDAPEERQTCTRGGEAYRCGAEAAMALSDALRGAQVRCEEVGRDRWRRSVAVCYVGGVDIGGEMVRQGYALDWPRYSKGAYAGEQAEARSAGRGLWAGEFEVPWEWRRR